MDILARTLTQIDDEFSRPAEEANTLHGILADFYWKPFGDEYACARKVLAFCGLGLSRDEVEAVARGLRRPAFMAMASEVEAVLERLRSNEIGG